MMGYEMKPTLQNAAVGCILLCNTAGIADTASKELSENHGGSIRYKRISHSHLMENEVLSE